MAAVRPAEENVRPAAESGASSERAGSERTVVELMQGLVDDGLMLVRQESQLLRLELEHKTAQLSAHARVAALGAAFGVVGLGAIASAAIAALTAVMPLWAAALTVGLASTAVGALMMRRGGRRLTAVRLAPQQVLDEVGRDVTALREALR